jgi:hypothetical protein
MRSGETWNALNMDSPNLYDEVCFMFELCDERTIASSCKHDAPRIVLHGARNLVVRRRVSVTA